MNWKKGDIAICINATNDGLAAPVRLNAEYIVQGIEVCPCGNESLDVGFVNYHPRGAIKCACERITLNEPIWWCNSKRFTKKQSLEEQRSEALKNEDYELLTKLRDNA